MNMEAPSPFHPITQDRLILETAECLAFYDRYPVSQGHALVVAKQVTPSLYDLSAETQAAVWDTVRRVRAILAEQFHPGGFNIGVNDGPTAGQTVPHAHVHIIPRYAGDVPDPRGGIRRVIPNKANYWDRASDVPCVEVIGIDVGVSKGQHVVALRMGPTLKSGTFIVLGNGVTVEEAARLCLDRSPACIGIDSPPAWSFEGNARKGERELLRRGLQLYATPSEVKKQALPFYGWMKVGFKLFEALRANFPLYRQGQVGQHALEVFPHATAFALAGRHKPQEMSKVRWRRQVLTDQGFEISALRNADCVDAALAAVTAAHALRGTFSTFGDPAEGVIVTPHLR